LISFPASAEATVLHARRFRALGLFLSIVAVYLEQPPMLSDVMGTIELPVAAVGLFAGPGRHASVDVDAALATRPAMRAAYVGAIGEDPGMAGVIAATIADAAGRVGFGATQSVTSPEGNN
jgi:sirohydrochlorin ferrochelatase